MPCVADFFAEHLGRLLDQPLLDGYETYTMDFSIYFRDLGQYWHLCVVDGCIQSLTGPDTAPGSGTVQFDVDQGVFFEIASGVLAPQKAFFLRRTNIRGNLFEGMKLAKLLSLFFARYPYVCEEPIT